MSRALRSGNILTLTFPPDDNPNYGGILQVWALQQALADLGVASAAGSLYLSAAGRARRWTRRSVARLLAVAGRGISRSSMDRVLDIAATAPILRFARREIQRMPVFDANQRVIPSRGRGFSCYIVGSDQVWRPGYADTADFMLGFLDADDPARRIAYAPSFGRSDPDFSSELVHDLEPLVHRFHAISVREDAGLEVVKSLWGISATRMPDPTLLLHPAQYSAMTATAEQGPRDGARYVSYILDRSQAAEDTIVSVESALGATFSALLPARPAHYRSYLRHPRRYQYPTIEAWLQSFQNAEFVITDSFHGCVFASLFNVPFAVVVNEKRGASRFQTLLRILGLTNRIASTPGDAAQLVSQSIDWDDVNRRIETERQRGRAFLSAAWGQG